MIKLNNVLTVNDREEELNADLINAQSDLEKSAKHFENIVDCNDIDNNAPSNNYYSIDGNIVIQNAYNAVKKNVHTEEVCTKIFKSYVYKIIQILLKYKKDDESYYQLLDTCTMEYKLNIHRGTLHFAVSDIIGKIYVLNYIYKNDKNAHDEVMKIYKNIEKRSGGKEKLALLCKF